MIPWFVCVANGVAAGLLVYGGWKILVHLWDQDGRPPLWTRKVKYLDLYPNEDGVTTDVPGPRFTTVLLWIVLGFLMGFLAKPVPPCPTAPQDPDCEAYKAQARTLSAIEGERHLTPLQRAQKAARRSPEPPWKKGGVE